MIKYCLIVLLSLLTMSSCLSTQVSTHTIPDGVGKEVYHWVSWPDKVELYERGGVYYARCEFYRVPARKTLYTTHILGKGRRGYSYHLNSRPEYREGMPPYLLFVRQRVGWDLISRLLPSSRCAV